MLGAIPPLPQCVFMVWCLVKCRNNFTFALPFTYLVIFTTNQRNCLNVETDPWSAPSEIKPIVSGKEATTVVTLTLQDFCVVCSVQILSVSLF
jgi:hypothetical protein